MNTPKILITAKVFLLLLVSVTFCRAQSDGKIYVSNSGSDSNPGTIEQPFQTLERAKRAVIVVKRKNPGLAKIQVIMRAGEYLLNKGLNFGPEDSGTSAMQIEYTTYPYENVVVGGGTALPARWVKSGGENIWKLNVSNIGITIRQLFANDKRLPRCSSDMLYTKGALPDYDPSIKKFDFTAMGGLRQRSIKAFCGFQYNNNDLDRLTDVSNAELILYNSWEASWHKIMKIDRSANLLYLTTPSRAPVGFFSPVERYRIENSKDFLNTPGEWYFDEKKGDLYYYANNNENPNSLKFITPTVDQLLTFKGNGEDDGSTVKYIVFSWIKFRYNISTWGVNDVPPAQKASFANKFPGINFNDGFSSAQAAPDCGDAILLTSANHIVFQNCDFSNFGTYVIRIGEYSNYNSVVNCKFHNLGGGGVVVGFNEKHVIEKGLPKAMSPSFNTVINCTIHDGGLLFPSAVGVLIMQANNTTVTHNEIFNFPYSGISCGWTWGFHDNFTSSNLIAYNTIHDVMQQLTDGGGIYTLGPQQNTVIKDNYIYNITRSKDAVGSKANGIFFDEGSSLMQVDSNVVKNVLNEDFRMNATQKERINFGTNSFQKSAPNPALMNAVPLKTGYREVKEKRDN